MRKSTVPVCCSSIHTCRYMKRSRPATPNISTDIKTCLRFMTLAVSYFSAFRGTHGSLLWNLQHACIFFSIFFWDTNLEQQEMELVLVLHFYSSPEPVQTVYYTQTGTLTSYCFQCLDFCSQYQFSIWMNSKCFSRWLQKTFPLHTTKHRLLLLMEGGDTCSEMPRCHTSQPVPTNYHSWAATAAAGGILGGQVAPWCCQFLVMGNPVPLLLDCMTLCAQGRVSVVTPITQFHSQCLGISSPCASGSHTLIFTLKHESKLSFADVTVRWYQ